MTLVQLEALWTNFSNIPINNDDEIEDDFYCWEKGLVVLKFGIGWMKDYQMELRNGRRMILQRRKYYCAIKTKTKDCTL